MSWCDYNNNNNNVLLLFFSFNFSTHRLPVQVKVAWDRPYSPWRLNCTFAISVYVWAILWPSFHRPPKHRYLMVTSSFSRTRQEFATNVEVFYSIHSSFIIRFYLSIHVRQRVGGMRSYSMNEPPPALDRIINSSAQMLLQHHAASFNVLEIVRVKLNMHFSSI